MELLAILGRGIQRETDGPWVPWVLTEDLEVCDERGAHLSVRVPANDGHPFCVIGGGEFNLLAGLKLCENYHIEVKAVVCAYGGRSAYLQAIDAPSESEIMSETLALWLRSRLSSPHSPGNHYLA